MSWIPELSTEQTRECMKLSMGTIKNKVLPLPDGTEVVLPEECPSDHERGKRSLCSWIQAER